MQANLLTVGAEKVGFTLVDNGGAPDFVAGVRGVVERNTMRYYLAIDSFLASQSESPSAQLEKRLQTWFTAVERYPRQLGRRRCAQPGRCRRFSRVRPGESSFTAHQAWDPINGRSAQFQHSAQPG